MPLNVSSNLNLSSAYLTAFGGLLKVANGKYIYV